MERLPINKSLTNQVIILKVPYAFFVAMFFMVPVLYLVIAVFTSLALLFVPPFLVGMYLFGVQMTAKDKCWFSVLSYNVLYNSRFFLKTVWYVA